MFKIEKKTLRIGLLWMSNFRPEMYQSRNFDQNKSWSCKTGGYQVSVSSWSRHIHQNLVSSNPDKKALVTFRLTHAVCLSVLCPVPISWFVTPPPPLSGQDVAWVAIELDHRPGGESKRRFTPVGGRRKNPTANHCVEKRKYFMDSNKIFISTVNTYRREIGKQWEAESELLCFYNLCVLKVKHGNGIGSLGT